MATISKMAVLKQRYFPRRSVGLCLEAVGWCDDAFGHEPTWPEVHAAILPVFYKTTAKRDAFVKDDQTAARTVLAVIADFAEREVSTGNFHVYRGVLSSRGASLRNVAELALSELHESDWLDYDEYQERLARLYENIRIAG